MPSAVRHAVRRLIKSPLFSAATLVTLAVGIGANTAIFSIVYGVLLKPLPFEDPERLVGIWHKAPGSGFDEINQGPASYLTYRDHNRTFQDVGPDVHARLPDAPWLHARDVPRSEHTFPRPRPPSGIASGARPRARGARSSASSATNATTDSRSRRHPSRTGRSS